jgi:hypothetical protein
MKLESSTRSHVMIPYHQRYQHTGHDIIGTEANIGVVIVGSWRVKVDLLRLKSSEYKITRQTPCLFYISFRQNNLVQRYIMYLRKYFS